MSSLSELFIRVVAIVTVIDDLLLGLGLAEAKTFDIGTKLVSSGVRAGTKITSSRRRPLIDVTSTCFATQES